MMKKILQIVLGLGIIALCYVLYLSMTKPIKFQQETKTRESAVIEKLKDIRIAQRAFKGVHNRYTGSFDTLTQFILNDSLTFQKRVGEADDSIQVAMGLVKVIDYKVPAKDTLFGKRLSGEHIKNLRYIPYTDKTEFILEAGMLTTESSVVVPVFSCRAPYKDFLAVAGDSLIYSTLT